MSIALITGSAGLIGSEAALHFGQLGMHIVGIDNDMRSTFFGTEASTAWNQKRLSQLLPDYEHHSIDIRNLEELERIFKRSGTEIAAVIHTAAQPSHDWAAREPLTDFSVNATGTLNLLELTRRHCPDAIFIFTSTNKVYGDRPNELPLVEESSRWEIDRSHPYFKGIPEEMSIDQSKHSLFGASKLAADVLVQEYGRYFGMRTACFRGGCLTGPNHSGTQLHGFLAYLMKCTLEGRPYTVFGYGGKQVRDNIHSKDLVTAFQAFLEAPRVGEVYNIGGGRESNCSMLEAIDLCQEVAGRQLNYTYTDSARSGDHIWYISDLTRFRSHFPEWRLTYDVPRILREMYELNTERWIPVDK